MAWPASKLAPLAGVLMVTEGEVLVRLMERVIWSEAVSPPLSVTVAVMV